MEAGQPAAAGRISVYVCDARSLAGETGSSEITQPSFSPRRALTDSLRPGHRQPAGKGGVAGGWGEVQLLPMDPQTLFTPITSISKSRLTASAIPTPHKVSEEHDGSVRQGARPQQAASCPLPPLPGPQGAGALLEGGRGGAN